MVWAATAKSSWSPSLDVYEDLDASSVTPENDATAEATSVALTLESLLKVARPS